LHFSAAAHILTTKQIASKLLEIDQDSQHTKFSALNVHSDCSSLNPYVEKVLCTRTSNWDTLFKLHDFSYYPLI